MPPRRGLKLVIKRLANGTYYVKIIFRLPSSLNRYPIDIQSIPNRYPTRIRRRPRGGMRRVSRESENDGFRFIFSNAHVESAVAVCAIDNKQRKTIPQKRDRHYHIYGKLCNKLLLKSYICKNMHFLFKKIDYICGVFLQFSNISVKKTFVITIVSYFGCVCTVANDETQRHPRQSVMVKTL